MQTHTHSQADAHTYSGIMHTHAHTCTHTQWHHAHTCTQTHKHSGTTLLVANETSFRAYYEGKLSCLSCFVSQLCIYCLSGSLPLSPLSLFSPLPRLSSLSPLLLFFTCSRFAYLVSLHMAFNLIDLYGAEVVSAWAISQMTSPEHFLDTNEAVELLLGVSLIHPTLSTNITDLIHPAKHIHPH
jgi:hypothetical protein